MALGMRRSWFWAALAGLVAVVAWYAFSGPRRTSAESEFAGVMADWRRADRSYSNALRHATGNAERKKVRVGLETSKAPLAERFLNLARAYPGSAQELASLCWAAGHAPETEAGRKARDMLVSGRIASSDPPRLAWALDSIGDATAAGLLSLTPVVLDRVKQSPNDPLAARLLTWVCTKTRGDESKAEVSPTFAEAADLIVSRHASSPDIANFCECFGMGFGSPPWARRYEPHLRTVLKENRDGRVRTVALFALASLVQDSDENRQAEAATLYEQFIREFPGQNPSSEVENELNRRAKVALKEIRSRGIDLPAPEIAGVDLNGKPMTLSEYRGKVVLLSFWATWCFPCMKLVPHERELAASLRGKPFAIVGINCDTDEGAAKQAVTKHRMPWRSFRDQMKDDRPISERWDVIGYPTLYLIDHAGVIRKRWIGTPPAAVLDREIDRLVKAASRRG